MFLPICAVVESRSLSMIVEAVPLWVEAHSEVVVAGVTAEVPMVVPGLVVAMARRAVVVVPAGAVEIQTIGTRLLKTRHASRKWMQCSRKRTRGSTSTPTTTFRCVRALLLAEKKGRQKYVAGEA